MIEKIKKNLLLIIFVVLLLIFISLKIFSFLESNKQNLDTNDSGSNVVASITPSTTESIDQDDKNPILNDYGDEITNTYTESSVVQYDIDEFVPFETDEFKIMALDDNQLKVAAKVDKDKAVESLNNFLKDEVTKESQTFEVVWQ